MAGLGRARETRKKEREIAPCRVVARAINELQKADYYVPDANYQLEHCREPVDVVLLSETGRHPARNVQVTTIPFVTNPSDLELRDDNGNISKIEDRLRRVLLERNVTALQLDICLAQSGVISVLPDQSIRKLAELVQSMRLSEHWSIDDRGIWRFSPDLAVYVSHVCGMPLPSPSILVHAGRGCIIPEDRRFIDEAILHKGNSKYSPTEVSSLTLVIEASSTVVPEQIDRYLSCRKPSEIPFWEVWIVPAFGDMAIALKKQS
jgi:hypothetical protein